MPQGRRKLEQYLAAMPEPESDASLSPRIRRLIEDMRAEWRELDRRIAAFDNEFAVQARSDPAARRLATIPGIGVLNATALVAAVGNGADLRPGRDLAAWLGLVPRQVTTGGRPRLRRHLYGEVNTAVAVLLKNENYAVLYGGQTGKGRGTNRRAHGAADR